MDLPPSTTICEEDLCHLKHYLVLLASWWSYYFPLKPCYYPYKLIHSWHVHLFCSSRSFTFYMSYHKRTDIYIIRISPCQANIKSTSMLMVQVFSNQHFGVLRIVGRICYINLREWEFMCLTHIGREGNYCVDKLDSFRVTHRCTRWWDLIPVFKFDSRNRWNLPNYRFVSWVGFGIVSHLMISIFVIFFNTWICCKWLIEHECQPS